MSQRVSRPAAAGVSLWPDAAHAVVVRDGAIVPVPAVPGGVDALPDLLRACLRALDGEPLGAVTVDVSPVLLAAVHRTPRALPPVAVIRIVPRPASDPVLGRSSATLERLVAARYTIPGGHDLFGAELVPLDRDALDAVCADLRERQLSAVALVGAGSQTRPVHERTVADAVLAAVPSARVAAASDYGGQGLAAREATVLLDSALAGVTDRVLESCERAVAAVVSHAALRVARGDGGSCAPFYARTLPAIGLDAQDGLRLAGAAYAAGQPDCRVLLPGADPDEHLAGEVRGGLPVIRAAEMVGSLGVLGTALAMPTAVLVPGRGPSAPPPPGVPVVQPTHDVVVLACIGAAVSRPTSWLDEVGFIATEDELERTRHRLVARATAIVMANGAAPGTPVVADESAVAMPYSPSGSVRLRVRVVGAYETAPVAPVARVGS